MKSLLLVLAAGLVVAAAQAAPASAAKPCGQAVIDDWWDGHIDKTYPKHCYADAINRIPSDIRDYSNAADDIRAAMLAALRDKGSGGPPSVSSSQAPRQFQGTGSTTKDPEKKGVILRAIEWLGPSDAASIPLPLLILAGVAFLLLAAAGGSLLNRHLQGRRMPPPQA